MSKAILISDHAIWCALMMNGDKTIEVRKGIALYKAIQKLIDENGYADIYVYCSKGKKHNEDLAYCTDTNKWKLWYGSVMKRNGKVIFKFRCYRVEEIEPFEEYNSPYGLAYKLTEKKIITCQKAQLTYDEYNHYLKGKNGYAIHISDLEIFDKPKELSEFYKVGKMQSYKDCQHLLSKNDEKHYKLTKTPQSYCYCESEE